MKPLSTFEKEINTNQEILSYTPKNSDYSAKYFALDHYLEIMDFSHLWDKKDNLELPKDFDINYIWEDEDIYKLDNQNFINLLDTIENFNPDINRLRTEYLKLVETVI